MATVLEFPEDRLTAAADTWIWVEFTIRSDDGPITEPPTFRVVGETDLVISDATQPMADGGRASGYVSVWIPRHPRRRSYELSIEVEAGPHGVAVAALSIRLKPDCTRFAVCPGVELAPDGGATLKVSLISECGFDVQLSAELRIVDGRRLELDHPVLDISSGAGRLDASLTIEGLGSDEAEATFQLDLKDESGETVLTAEISAAHARPSSDSGGKARRRVLAAAIALGVLAGGGAVVAEIRRPDDSATETTTSTTETITTTETTTTETTSTTETTTTSDTTTTTETTAPPLEPVPIDWSGTYTLEPTELAIDGAVRDLGAGAAATVQVDPVVPCPPDEERCEYRVSLPSSATPSVALTVSLPAAAVAGTLVREEVVGSSLLLRHDRVLGCYQPATDRLVGNYRLPDGGATRLLLTFSASSIDGAVTPTLGAEESTRLVLLLGPDLDEPECDAELDRTFRWVDSRLPDTSR